MIATMAAATITVARITARSRRDDLKRLEVTMEGVFLSLRH
jgi:hypothetical protein